MNKCSMNNGTRDRKTRNKSRKLQRDFECKVVNIYVKAFDAFMWLLKQ